MIREKSLIYKPPKYVTSLMAQTLNQRKFDHNGDVEILYFTPIGTANYDDWFSLINEKDLDLIRNNKAVLLIDISLDSQGNSTQNLEIDLKKRIHQYNLPVENIFVISCNFLFHNGSSESYIHFVYLVPNFFSTYANKLENKIDISSINSFIDKPNFNWLEKYSTTFEKKYLHLKNNVQKIQPFSLFLGKTGWKHRETFYKILKEEGLWNKEYCSYSNKTEFTESEKDLISKLYDPDYDDINNEIWNKLLSKECLLDSFVGVVSETCYYGNDPICTIERPLINMMRSSPFIFFGQKNIAKIYNQLGIKTFDKYFDTVYDTVSDDKRMYEIIKLMKQIVTIEDKLSVYESMREDIEYNYNIVSDWSENGHPTLHTFMDKLKHRLENM